MCIRDRDNCTAKDQLRYSFGPDVTKPNRVITCADIPNGREALLVVDIYVHDLADNKDLCKVSLKVQDNSSAEFLGGACKDTTGALTTIPNKLSGQHNSSVQPSTITEINTLNQNYPNPFSRKTVISVNLALPMDGTLNITDIQGRVIKSIKRNWNKGYNEVIVEKSELRSSGIFYYSFQSEVFVASKKMIIPVSYTHLDVYKRQPQGSYTVKDNCVNAETNVLVVSVEFIDYGCDSFYLGKVIRHLIATDPWGNTNECEKEFFIKRISLDSIVLSLIHI